MPQLDLDLDMVEKVATIVALVGIADLCTELAVSLRDQRRARTRELAPAPAPAALGMLGLGLRYDVDSIGRLPAYLLTSPPGLGSGSP